MTISVNCSQTLPCVSHLFYSSMPPLSLLSSSPPLPNLPPSPPLLQDLSRLLMGALWLLLQQTLSRIFIVAYIIWHLWMFLLCFYIFLVMLKQSDPFILHKRQNIDTTTIKFRCMPLLFTLDLMFLLPCMLVAQYHFAIAPFVHV